MALIRQQTKIRTSQAAVSGWGRINPTVDDHLGSASLGAATALTTGAGSVIAQQPYTPPSWSTIPNLTFANGQAGRRSVGSYLTQGTELAVVSANPTSANGITFDTSSLEFVYDGRTLTSIPSTNSFTLTADDSLTLTSFQVRESSGTVGHVFGKGQVPTGTTVTGDVDGFQCIIKNRWPDGSAKIAILSWNDDGIFTGVLKTISLTVVATTTTTPIALTALQTAAPDVELVLGSLGTITLVDLLATPFRQWLSGPECSEWHFRSEVTTQLVVWFYVRLYASGKIWIRTFVENGAFVLLSTQDKAEYQAVLTINSTVRYDSTTDLVHRPRCRWTRTDWYDGRALQAPVFSKTHLINSKLVPGYGYTPTEAAFTWDGSSGSGWYDANAGQQCAPETVPMPLDLANQRPDMSGGGYSPTIGLLPLWDVLYLLSGRSDMYNCSIANANAAGVFDMILRDHETELPFAFSDHPNMWLQQGYSDPNSVYAASNGTPYVFDTAHVPSMSYAAYLWTGDYYYVEQAQMQCVRSWAFVSYLNREGAAGIFGEQVREIAWGMRDLAYAACITPDGDALGTEMRNSLAANVDRLYAEGVTGTYWATAPNNIGALRLHTGNIYGNGSTQYYVDAPWQQHFLGATLALVQDLSVLSGTDKTKIDACALMSLKHPVMMLGDNNGWPYVLGGSYTMTYLKPAGYPPPSTDDWAADGGEAYDWYLEFNGGTDVRPVSANAALQDGYVGQAAFAQAMWANLMPAISYAVERGVQGADAAWARMIAASNWQANSAYFNDRAVWAMRPRT